MPASIELIDIRRTKEETSTIIPNLSNLLEGLSKPPGQRAIPSEVLYDTTGLQLYNDGIKHYWAEAGYYPIVAEKEILSSYGDNIASELVTDNEGRAVIIELGAGSLEKTSKLLVSLSKRMSDSPIPHITYYALDIDRDSINESLQQLHSHCGSILSGKVAAKGMWGTFQDAFALLSDEVILSSTLNISHSTPIHILFLGSTIGNFSKGDEDVSFLRSVCMNRERGDRWILGVDKRKDVGVMERAYGEHGRPWMMNGLRVAGRALGDDKLFEEGKWDKWTKYNVEKGRVEMGYKALTSLTLNMPKGNLKIDVLKDEVIMVMFSNKYTEEEIKRIFHQAQMDISNQWTDKNDMYWLFSLSSTRHRDIGRRN